MELRREKIIRSSAAILFECVVDDQLIPQWMTELVSVTYLEPVDPARNPVGVEFKQRVREGMALRNYNGIVRVYEQDRHFGIEFSDRRFRFLLDYRIESVPEGCRLDYHLRTVEESLLMRLASGAVKTMAANMVERNLRQLKRFAEQRQRPPNPRFA